MKALYDKVSLECSRVATRAYSTSFSLGVRCLSRELRSPIYSIYGFVRFADEIVDSFHCYNKEVLLEKFKSDTYCAIQDKISMNPILNSFQHTVHEYRIEKKLIDQFLKSMEMDLLWKTHDDESFKEYIFGSAEVVGLMCLCVFVKDNPSLFEQLKPHAMRLGAAFQKINFLRDLNADFVGLGRVYFPGIDFTDFNDRSKKDLENEISEDFRQGYIGIRQLPKAARFGVYVAYVYYLALFRKIKNTPSKLVLKSRIRIPKREKAILLAYSFIRHQLKLL